MDKSRVDYTLYLVTDSRLLSTDTLQQAVELACQNGVTLVQLREKGASSQELAAAARELKLVTNRYGVPLIVNDDPRAALEAGADGAHVGLDDMSVAEARTIMGNSGIVGASAHSVDEALRAQREGADYLGVGAMFGSSTKSNVTDTPVSTLRAIVDAVDIPCVAIGGVNAQNIPQLQGSGAVGVAVVSAIMAAPDIPAACQELRAAIARYL